MQSEEGAELHLILRGNVRRNRIDRLRQYPGVVDVYLDTEIAPFPVTIESVVHRADVWDADDSLAEEITSERPQSLLDVATCLGAPRVWAEGVTGKGIVIGIVDGGIASDNRFSGAITCLVPQVVDGWPTAEWGKTFRWGLHANMTATDALGIAPQAQLYDIRISDAPGVAGRISDALAGYQWAVERFREDGTPHILSNGWGIYQEEWDPIYASEFRHPFTRKVEEAIEEGILVLFAAGDCGAGCPSRACGTDCGPGRSIWGANGHPRVMTVGAANLTGQLAAYSSQGPAALDRRKPDFCGLADFAGYFCTDSGTSAACPVAAGVVALLKQARPTLTQEQAKLLLQRSAKPIGGGGWNPSSGTGIIQADGAYRVLRDELGLGIE